VSAVAIARQVALGRLNLTMDLQAWVERSVHALGASTLPILHSTAIEAYRLPPPFHRDPADRLLVAAARLAIPGVAITTDVIVGFPGESETEFAESLELVRRMRFAGGHVFTYSARPGTAARRMPDQVPHPLRKERNAQMRHALAEAALDFQARFLGSVLPVLWESAAALDPQGWRMSGLTDNYLRVTAHAGQHLWNRITPVRLTALDKEGILGYVEG